MIRKKRDNNLISLIVGVVFILIGLAWASIIINTSNITTIIVIPISILILGAVLALMGGLMKWKS